MARYVEILFRFKARFALLLIVVPAIVGAVTILMFPSYKATAQLWVDSPGYFGGNQPEGWNQYATPAQNESDSLGQILSTRAFQQGLYKQLGDAVPDSGQRAKVVGNAKVSIVPTGTHLILVTASCNTPSMCPVVVNAAIEVMRAQQIDNEKNQARAGVAFVTGQLQQAQTNLTASQGALRAYLAAHPSASVGQSGVPSTLQDPQLTQLQSDLQNQQNHVNDLQNQLSNDNNIVSLSTALIESGPRIVDAPLITRGRPIGDGSGLKLAAITGGVAFGIGVGYLLLLSWLDKTLRDPREIEHRFKVPVVTTIPELQPSERF
jgi:capsular polysaccharide biosynthesis protein